MILSSKNNIIIAGTSTRDAEYREIGEKNTPVVSFSLAVNARNEEGRFVNCKAFNDTLAGYAMNIKKGDTVAAAGVLESREYNEKTYVDLNVQWLHKLSKNTPVKQEAQPVSTEFEELDDLDEEELPF